VPCAISLVFALAGMATLRMAGTARKSIAGLLVGQCVALTAALAGHAWQIDAHMTFFAALAILVVMNDIGIASQARTLSQTR
jgi:methyl-accepting chemotaxis protein